MLLGDIKVREREFSFYDVSYDKWIAEKPHGISGCFRLKNEQEFMLPAVESHIEWLDEVILALQPSTGQDATHWIAQHLGKKYPEKVKIVHYPFNLYGFNSFGHWTLPANSIYTLTHFTNWAIAQCKYSWVAKIEGDVIAMSSFGRIRENIDKAPDDDVYYGRVGLNVAGKYAQYVSEDMPRNAGWDEGVFPNHPEWRCEIYGKWESINFNNRPDRLRNNGFDFYHVQRCKHKKLTPGKDETWIPFQRASVEKALIEYNRLRPYPGPDGDCPDILFEEKPCLYRRLGIGSS